MILKNNITFYDIKQRQLQNQGYFMQEDDKERIEDITKQDFATEIKEDKIVETLNKYIFRYGELK